MFLNGACFLPFQTFLTSLLTEGRHLSLELASVSWAIVGVGGILGGFLFGVISDGKSVKLSLIIAYAGLLLAALFVWRGFSMWSDYLAIAIFGVAYSGIFGQSAAYLAKTENVENATFLTGLSFVALGLGSALGNYCAGMILHQSSDYSTVYGTISIGVGLCFVISFCLPWKAEQSAGAMS